MRSRTYRTCTVTLTKDLNYVAVSDLVDLVFILVGVDSGLTINEDGVTGCYLVALELTVHLLPPETIALHLRGRVIYVSEHEVDVMVLRDVVSRG